MPSLEKYVQKIHKKLNNERLEEAKVRSEEVVVYVRLSILYLLISLFIALFMKSVD